LDTAGDDRNKPSSHVHNSVSVCQLQFSAVEVGRLVTSQSPSLQGPGSNWCRDRTFALEVRRSVSIGILESGWTTFLLLIAVQFFDFGPFLKGLIVISMQLGLLLSPLCVSLTQKMGWTAGMGAARVAWVGCGGFVLATLGTDPWMFVLGSMFGMMGASASIPLLTQIYQENYSSKERGDLFSRAVIVRMLSMIVFSWLGGLWLDAYMDQFQVMMGVFAIASGLAALWSGKFPSTKLHGVTSSKPWSGMRHVRCDKVFRWVLVSWMFMGIGNLILLPLRVEFLANPVYGMEMSPLIIALAVGIIPNATRLLFARMWGRLFDSMNFFVLRIIINLFFVAGALGFFIIGGLTGVYLGGFLLGMGMAGGDVAWSLWVTKIAKPELVAEYMGVHTFLTGIRGVLAPFLGFYLALYFPMSCIAIGAILMILVASALLLPEARSFYRRRQGKQLEPKPPGLQE